LSIHEAMSRSWVGQLDDAERMLDEAEKRLREKDKTLETQALFGHLNYVRSRITAMHGDFEKSIQLCLTARENTPPENQGLLGGIGVMLGYGYFLNGDFSQAEQTLTQTVETGKRSGAVNTTIGAICVLARLYALRGELHRAFDLYREAETIIQDAGVKNQGARSIVDVGYAEILFEWNNLEAALQHIQQGLALIPLWSKADDIALAHVIHARIQFALGNSAAAEEAVDLGKQVVQSSGVFPEARNAVLSAQSWLHIQSENSPQTGSLAVRLEKQAGLDTPLRFINERPLISLARLYAAQQKITDSLDLLARLEAHVRSAGRIGRLIEILVQKAVALNQLGDQTQAQGALTEGLQLAEPEAFRRVFLDAGQPIQRLLSTLLPGIDVGPLQDYARHLLAQFEVGQGIAPPAQPLLEPLSEREIEVLELIAQGKTNKEIAAQLIISPGTVKAHSSSIYRKLDVANRTEAVAAARQLNILS